RGVFHAAGIDGDGLLADLDAAALERVLAPKAEGAMHLHALTAEDSLDLFVLFSSSASLFGAPGQGAYAMANATLDAIAQHRRACGLAATAVQLGPIAGDGMAARAGARAAERWRRAGIRLLDANVAIDAAIDAAFAEGEGAAILD